MNTTILTGWQNYEYDDTHKMTKEMLFSIHGWVKYADLNKYTYRIEFSTNN